jgi:signal transduction histidine kinase
MSASGQLSLLPLSGSQGRSGKNILLELSIGQRLTLCFILTALLAAATVGLIGLQRVQALDQQSNFSQSLLQTTSTLPVGANLLILMNIQTHVILNDAASHLSQETLADDWRADQRLASSYDRLLTDYLAHHLLSQHSDQVSLLNQANLSTLVKQQAILAGSALRTWHYYRDVQREVLQDINVGQVTEAQRVEHLEAEPMHADALSAMRALTLFNDNMANSVRETTVVEERTQFIMTLCGALFVATGIVLAGGLLSQTVVPRLSRLRSVTQFAKQGQLDARLPVVGHDEISEVSASVNALLETMVADAIAYEQQRQVNQFKDQFIMNMSHELRTPLAQVYGYLELLIDYHAQLDSIQQISFLSNAASSCRELIQLVNTVLDATRLNSEVKSPQCVDVPVRSLVQEVLEQFEPRQRSNFSIHLDVPADLAVLADPQYLRQVVRNLISNAFKYAPQQTTISIIAVNHGQADEDSGIVCPVCIYVRDQGPGIPPEETGALFQKFVRLKRDMTSTIRGTGLGLYVSKQLIEAMHGRIWVESSGIDGEGSCFCFMLPGTTAPAGFAEEL